MRKRDYNRIKLGCLIAVLLVLPPRVVVAETEIETDTEEQIVAITEEEQGVLEELYRLEQEIKESEVKEAQITEQITVYQEDVLQLEAQIAQDEASFDKNRDVLKEVLRTYQRMGPASFVEILLDSKSLGELITRMNTLRDLARNTGELMAELKADQAKLTQEKQALSEKLAQVEEEQRALELVLEEKRQLKGEQEAYLATLEEQKSHYEELLNEVNVAWEALRPVFFDATQEFSTLVESGGLPQEAIDLSLGMNGIVGTISEEDFNGVVESNEILSIMHFEFLKDQIELSIPERKLVLLGNFIRQDASTLRFEVVSGTFYELPLEKTSIDELFEKGYMVLNLKPLIGDNEVKTVVSKEGSLVLTIELKLF